MKITREIPDEAAGDYKFMAIITINGHGRPQQLEHEYRKVLERIMHNEFGRNARVTSLTRAAYERQATSEDTLSSDDLVVLIDSPNDSVVED